MCLCVCVCVCCAAGKGTVPLGITYCLPRHKPGGLERGGGGGVLNRATAVLVVDSCRAVDSGCNDANATPTSAAMP